ncbi:MAG: class I SAM-dependent methyltransferase [Nitrospinaceae bacterium]
MDFYEEYILPWGIDLCLRGEDFARQREKYLQDVAGEVLEVGFGSGLNLPHFSNKVSRLLALDPSRLGRRLARRRIRQCPFPVEFLDLEDAGIPLPEAAVDVVVTTWTLCTIPDADAALREMLRVLRPGGRYVFVEHGLSPDPDVAKWQNRLNPIQKCLAGGCNLNRQMDALISGAGFQIETLDRFYFRAPKFACYLYAGRAVKPSP